MANHMFLFRQCSQATAKQLSRLLNISVHTYYYYEKGRMDVPHEIVMLLSLIYKVPAEYILCDNLAADDDVLGPARHLAQLDEAERYKTMISHLTQSNQDKITYRLVRQIKDAFREAHHRPGSESHVHIDNLPPHREDE